VFYNWGRYGSASFSLMNSSNVPDQPFIQGGNYSIKIWGDEDSYMYSNILPGSLRGGRTYLVDFYSNTPAFSSGMGYSVFDSYNSAYLDSHGDWAYGSEQILYAGPTGGNMIRNRVVFDTLQNAKIQLRFHPPQGGIRGSIDNLSVTELHDFTMSVWLKPEGAGQVLFQASSEFPQVTGLNWTFTNSTNLHISFDGNASYAWTRLIRNNISFPDNGWHQVTFSAKRTGTYSIYLDGALVAGPYDFRDAKISRFDMPNTLYIGKASAVRSFSGGLDELRIYKRALSASEARSLYQGKFQLPCDVLIASTYSGGEIASNAASANYNADVLVRKLLPSCILDMPFDPSIISNATGAIPDYSPSLASGTLYGTTQWTANGKSN
jgi:hypothetical protein